MPVASNGLLTVPVTTALLLPTISRLLPAACERAPNRVVVRPELPKPRSHVPVGGEAGEEEGFASRRVGDSLLAGHEGPRYEDAATGIHPTVGDLELAPSRPDLCGALPSEAGVQLSGREESPHLRFREQQEATPLIEGEVRPGGLTFCRQPQPPACAEARIGAAVVGEVSDEAVVVRFRAGSFGTGGSREIDAAVAVDERRVDCGEARQRHHTGFPEGRIGIAVGVEAGDERFAVDHGAGPAGPDLRDAGAGEDDAVERVDGDAAAFHLWCRGGTVFRGTPRGQAEVGDDGPLLAEAAIQLAAGRVAAQHRVFGAGFGVRSRWGHRRSGEEHTTLRIDREAGEHQLLSTWHGNLHHAAAEAREVEPSAP